MIKNLAIGGVVGLLFMTGGFWFGLRLVPMPASKKVVAAASAKAPAGPVAPRNVISIDALKKTSEGMMDMNQALQAREQAVAAREKKARQVEDELAAERAALDRSHQKFHELYGQFQQRLQLVSGSEADQLQRQMTIYTTMDPAQAADLLRSLDDGTIVRLFSIMETKPLANLVAAWKTKYPGDSTRLLTALTTMGRVVPQDKIALPDPAPDASAAPSAPAAGSASDSGNGAAHPATADSNSAAATATSSAPASGSPPEALSGRVEAIGAPDAAPAGNDTTSTASDATGAPSPDATAPGTDSNPNANGPAPGASAPSGGKAAPAAAPLYSTPDASSSTAAPTVSPLAPPAESAAPRAMASATASPASDGPSLLGVPGETAAQAAAIAQRRTGRLSATISTDRYY